MPARTRGAFPVTVDAAAPTATVAITAIATDSGTSSSDYVTSDTTLTVSGTHGPLGSGEKVQVSSDGGATWADATSTASTWSYTDPTPHGTSFTYQARIVDAVGNVGANTASQAVTIDTAAPTAPSITSIPENSGGGINAGEASDGTPVVVGLAGTGAAAGDTLTVNWGGQTVAYTLLAGRHLGQQRDGDGAGRDDHGPGQRHVRRDGPADRCGGQCRRNLGRLPGDGRHHHGTDVDPDLVVAVSDPLVSNAEKPAVEFAVSGLDTGSTADVTFTATAGTPVVVQVTGNGPATANLSGLADGPVAVSIVATDAAGNTATGTGTSLTLDSTADAGTDLAVAVSDNSINAAEKAAAGFTVSGLDADAGADVTFTGTAGTPVVVHVTGNGSASANLSGLADGPVTVSIVATDAAGNTAIGTGTSLTLDTHRRWRWKSDTVAPRHVDPCRGAKESGSVYDFRD